MWSEWWPLFAVFWGLYLADGIHGGRRQRLFFSTWGYGRLFYASSVQASWHITAPLPSAWTLSCDDLPAALAPEGLTNWPAVSASRPPPLPDFVTVLRWEDIHNVKQHHGWIHLNHQPFTPATPALTADSLKQLTRQLAPLSKTERATALRHWHSRRFATAHLKRRIVTALARSQTLVAVNTLQIVLFAMLTGYLLLDIPSLLPTQTGHSITRLLPILLINLLALHFAAVFRFFQLHRIYFPSASQERITQTLTALLVPPQAMRLRQQLCGKLAEGFHPLAVAMVVAYPSTLWALAADTFRDARYPRSPATLSAEASALVRSATNIIDPIAVSRLVGHDPQLALSAFFLPPSNYARDACAYCPRCGDQFIRLDGSCPHGVPLCKL